MNKTTKSETPGKQPASLSATLRDLLWVDHTPWGKFGIIMIALLALSTTAALIARIAYFKPDYAGTYHIALIAPLSGQSKQIGQSLLRGAELYARDFNESGGLDGRYVKVRAYDDAGDPARARALAKEAGADKKIVAVIGPWSAQNVGEAAPELDRAGLAAMSMAPAAHDLAQKHKSLFALTYSQGDETRFLANYMRNVLGDKLASVVSDEAGFSGMGDLFTKTFERFGIPIRHRWRFDSSATDAKRRLAEIVAEIKAANDSGTVYLAMGEREAAQLIKLMRDEKAINKVMGPHMLGTRSFTAAFGDPDYEIYTNAVITAAPLMFDTANQKAQGFRARFLKAHGTAPDWIAAFGYESALIIAQSMRAITEQNDAGALPEPRKQILGYLAELTDRELGIRGITGVTAFTKSGVSSKPIQVGKYDGRHVISALIQLQPIGAGEVSNYIQAVREGRALYVNDRFMYKTGVVYSGMSINEIREFDPLTQTFQMDFVIWFRFRGDFKPEDVVFKNAVEPITLGTPDRTEKIGDLTYRRYKVSAKFNANFLDVRRNYGNELFGTSFRHRTLNRNNLLYVVDVVGIGLAGGESFLDKIRKSKLLAPRLGLVPDRAWIAQDIVRSSGLGAPTFVGHGKPPPDFSQIDVALVVKEATVSLRDFVPNEYLIYLLIFAFLGSVFAFLMDRKRAGMRLFWNAQSWLLRLLSWPLLLLAAGSLILNFAFQNLEFFYINMIVPVYETLWWIIGALLAAMAVERFIWVPLENRTERKVPGAIRASTTIVIFLFAAFGVVAFVLNQELTSLLATSGLVAMIIGLAVQANIANIFSGIILNLERPFLVGDWITLEGNTGEVLDITWRSIRLNANGHVISIPNSNASESEVVRKFPLGLDVYRVSVDIHVSPNHPPEKVCELLIEAGRSIDRIQTEPWAKMIDVIVSETATFAQYRLTVQLPKYEDWFDRYDNTDLVWKAAWKKLNENGISLAALPGSKAPVPAARSAPYRRPREAKASAAS